MLEKLEILESRYVELEQQLSDPAVLADIDEYRKYAKKHGELSEIVSTFREFKDICKEMEDTRSLFDEDLEEELLELAETDLSELEEKKGQLEEKLKFLLLPRDPRDKKNVIVEIRAGTGGDEAALFASDLFRMYSYYAERQGWKVEVLDSHPTDMGGYKEIIFQVNGNYVFSKLKFESGAHRVQRIPVTESGGRIHTSAATVAVLPEAEEVEVEINPQDLRIDIFCSSGPGGQSVSRRKKKERKKRQKIKGR